MGGGNEEWMHRRDTVCIHEGPLRLLIVVSGAGVSMGLSALSVVFEIYFMTV